MLEQVLAYLHNYFIDSIISGEFVIEDGSIDLGDALQDGQYFRICDSTFNDGVYQYPTSDLVDETFQGAVWAMAVPPSVIALSTEIEDWVGKNKDVLDSPYQSESFGGYSYSKAVSASGAGSGAYGWKDAFGSRLNRWRKIRTI